MPTPWIFMTLAIIGEVVGTSALKASAGFTNLWPSVLVVVGYGAALFFFALALKSIPVGVAYAVWSGVGIVLLAVIGFVVFKQTLDWAALLGIGLILAGVIVINTLSTSINPPGPG